MTSRISDRPITRKDNIRLSVYRTLIISLAYAWISVFNSVLDNGLPVILTAPLADNGLGLGYTAKGVVMALDNILGLFLLPLFGRLSDRSKNRFGKRTPFILLGGIGALASWVVAGFFLGLSSKWMFLIALSSGLAFIALSRPAALSLLPDFTDPSQRRSANAITQIVSIVSTVVGIGIIAFFSAKGYNSVFYATSAVMLVLVVLFLITVRERHWTQQGLKDQDFLREPAFHEGATKRNRWLFLTTVFFFYVAYNGLVSSLSNYAVEVLHLSKERFVLPQAITLLMACAAAVPVAKLSARFRRKSLLLAGLILMSISFIIAGLQSGLNAAMFICFMLVGLGFSMIIVNIYPFMLELSDSDKVGTATGVFNTVITVAMVLTPIASGWLSERFGISILFKYCTAALAAAIAALLFLQDKTKGEL